MRELTDAQARHQAEQFLAWASKREELDAWARWSESKGFSPDDEAAILGQATWLLMRGDELPCIEGPIGYPQRSEQEVPPPTEGGMAEYISTNLTEFPPRLSPDEWSALLKQCIADMKAHEEREPLVLVLRGRRLSLERIKR